MRGGDPTRLNPEGACPAFFRPKPDPFRPRPGEQIAEQRIVVPGPKMRGVASIDDGSAALGPDVDRHDRPSACAGAEHELRARPVSGRAGSARRAPRRGCDPAQAVAGPGGVRRRRRRHHRRPRRPHSTGTASQIEAERVAPPGAGGARARRSPALPTSQRPCRPAGRAGPEPRRAGLHPHLQARVRARAVDEAGRRASSASPPIPICRWSGRLGPKLREGDSQAPEGFYTVDAKALNPASRWHRSFNLGFPNAFDRAHDRTGSLRHGARRLRLDRLLCHDRPGRRRDLAPGDGSAQGGPAALPRARLPVPHDRGEPGQPRASALGRRSGATLKQGYDAFEATQAAAAHCRLRGHLQLCRRPCRRATAATRSTKGCLSLTGGTG